MSEKAGWKILRLFFFFIYFLGGSSAISGQNNGQQSEIQNFITNHIPVVSQNWEIYQDPVTRYIYFANSAGLVEYNGISARTFAMPYKQSVRSVYVNDDGLVFTGSFEDFGYWEKDHTGGRTYHSLSGDPDVAKNDEIWNIFELNSTVFFQSFTTVYAYDYNNVRAISCPSFMLFFFRVGDKFLAQALDNGLYWFDGSEFTFIEESETFQSAKVHAVIDFNFNDLWICTANNGIFTFDGQSFTPLKTEISEYLKDETCNAGLAISDTLIVFGTILEGVVFCNRTGEILNSFDYTNGLNNNTVLSLFRDLDDGLWIGLDEGANYINLKSPFTLYSNNTGTLGTIYTAIRKDNSLYLGTNHGLFVSDIKQNQGEYYFTDLRIIPNTQGQVWKLAEFDGQILCGHNEGTYLLDNGSFRLISDVTGGWSLKQFNERLLEGTYTGIVVFDKDERDRWRFRNKITGYAEPTKYIEIDYLGYVWAIHPQKGIYRLELNESMDSVVNTLYFNSIADTSNKLTMSRINNQVVFMTSEYIYAFDYENKTFYPIKSLEPGLGEYIKATQIMHYKQNSYWFILGNRIALIDISKDLMAVKETEFFHKYADLPGREQQIISVDPNTLLIPTRQAFTTFNLSRLNIEKTASSVEIIRLVFSGKAKSTVNIPGIFQNPSIPDRENNLTVFLANPGHFDREDKEYLYRIRELGEQWHRTTLDNFSFLNLKFGHYHLQVKEALGKEIAEAEFTINRPNYLSTPAILLYLLILAGLIIAGIKIFRVELERHRRLIEYEVGKNRLESELDYKSYELMLTMRYLIRKTDILRELHEKLESLKTYSSKFPVRYIREMERIIDHGLDSQTEEWQNVMKNLKLSQEGFFRKLKEKYPSLTPNDLRL
ncbi:MAG TPA: hypothetical protein VMV74_11310, partial [Bacteroidales bacterium]|nr:hypothetical protein [Bacteroidales bacterium]